MTKLGISRAKGLLVAGIFAGGLASLAAVAHAATESVLYSFQNNGKDGYFPAAGLMGVSGTLYGTTSAGGTGNCLNGCGAIFSINVATGAEAVLYSFTDALQNPVSPGSLVEANGTLFGTTSYGGNREAGMLFSYDLNSSAFDEQYYFCNLDNCTDGEYPSSSLLNVGGVLYGTTLQGGSSQYGGGTVFSFDTASQTETVLHTFGVTNSDGYYPYARLVRVGHLLYGTTEDGGTNDKGTLFSVNPKTGAESVIYSFCSQQNCADGESPSGNLIYKYHALYGTTSGGGANSQGTVFSIDLATRAEHVLHSFGGSGSADGAYPSGLVYAKHTLFGTTQYGGVNCSGGCGTVYSIDPITGTETVIYSFCNQTDCADGAAPASALLNVNGTLYGVTAYGGTGTCVATEYQVAGCGTVFAIK